MVCLVSKFRFDINLSFYWKLVLLYWLVLHFYKVCISFGKFSIHFCVYIKLNLITKNSVQYNVNQILGVILQYKRTKPLSYQINSTEEFKTLILPNLQIFRPALQISFSSKINVRTRYHFTSMYLYWYPWFFPGGLSFHWSFFLFGFFFTNIHRMIHRAPGERRGYLLTPIYQFHPLHKHLDISQAVIADIHPCT